MSRLRAYIKPFDLKGNYVANFIEVTDYIEKIGDMTIDSDSTGYDIGVYRNSGFTITLDNRDGLFSDIDTTNTIFKYKRTDAQVKITLDLANYDLTPTAADSMFDQYPTNETILFEGLLNDDSLNEDAKVERVQFRVLGFENIFTNEKILFTSFALGNNIEQIIYGILNVDRVTSLLTVSPANIQVGLNQIPDAVAQLENKSIKAVLDELLLMSNSVLYIKDRVIYVKPRSATNTVQYTFYGPNASTGINNLEEVKNITNGQNKLFNFFSWRDSTQTAARNSSINKYNDRLKELSSELFTNNEKQFFIMESLLNEFGFPKQEMDVTTKLDYETLAIQLLDRVNMDYPLQYVESEGFEFPICGIAICGQAILPKPILSFSMKPTKHFKVIKKTILAEKRNMSFRIREI